jgi:CubicO group peptidase (beta-lactamase class C family)
LSALHADGRFSGAVILGRNGETLYEDAWGAADLATGALLTPDTPLDGASLAKTFTAAALWLLVDDGKVDLDAPVQRYVPAFHHAATTVKPLLQHSAGVPEWSELPERYDVDRLTNVQLIAALREVGTPPMFVQGSRYE